MQRLDGSQAGVTDRSLSNVTLLLSLFNPPSSSHSSTKVWFWGSDPAQAQLTSTDLGCVLVQEVLSPSHGSLPGAKLFQLKGSPKIPERISKRALLLCSAGEYQLAES